jgi:hypothetical protein
LIRNVTRGVLDVVIINRKKSFFITGSLLIANIYRSRVKICLVIMRSPDVSKYQLEIDKLVMTKQGFFAPNEMGVFTANKSTITLIMLLYVFVEFPQLASCTHKFPRLAYSQQNLFYKRLLLLFHSPVLRLLLITCQQIEGQKCDHTIVFSPYCLAWFHPRACEPILLTPIF